MFSLRHMASPCFLSSVSIHAIRLAAISKLAHVHARYSGLALALGRVGSRLGSANYLHCSGSEMISFLGLGDTQVKLYLGPLKW